MIALKKDKSKINGIMELKCAVKRRSENMKRNMDFQRHIELINCPSSNESFTKNYCSQSIGKDIAQAKSSKADGDENQSRKQITE